MVDTRDLLTSSPVSAKVVMPHAYADSENFSLELKKVFRSSWVFAGFASSLRNKDDYITKQIGGISVVIQNFDGEIRAFHNVCSHRFSEIQKSECGNRRLQCPYHGWIYNKDGTPIGIPGNETFFSLDQEKRIGLRLERFRVEACGDFIFVNIDDNKIGLMEYIGEYYDIIKNASYSFPFVFDSQSLEWEADWKIGIESILEVYHVDSVHPDTFKPFFIKKWDIEEHGDHSMGRAYLSESGNRYWDGIVKHLKLVRNDQHHGYENFMIFPNLAVGITYGSMMSVQTYDPVAPGRCRLKFQLSMADGNGRRSEAVQRHIEDHLRAINLKVLDEDRAISESVQRGIVQVQRPPLTGTNEARIRAFHQAYLARMSD
eukprot:TRINITY_DN97446_c0_g1_i1.p1 TRINITY_DN97446_c0_g1~~TRINITY_DN97446_c0_g1_i1.p1  ORF type:complete len:373 (-),score=16.69 TRINITY_DN97446_c0_g1_i1:170-1288(-)